MSNFSERLKTVRKTKKMTQKELANSVGMSENQYQFYEYGKKEPTIGTFKKFCISLNVSADYLLGLSDNPDLHN